MPTAKSVVLAPEFSKTKLDRCGELLTKKAAADAELWRDELDVLLAEIRDHYKDHKADLPIRAEGTLYYIDLTAREFKGVITNKRRAYDALRKALGMQALVEALTYTFKLLDQHVTKTQQGTFVIRERTGSRDVSAVPIVAPKAA